MRFLFCNVIVCQTFQTVCRKPSTKIYTYSANVSAARQMVYCTTGEFLLTFVRPKWSRKSASLWFRFADCEDEIRISPGSQHIALYQSIWNLWASLERIGVVIGCKQEDAGNSRFIVSTAEGRRARISSQNIWKYNAVLSKMNLAIGLELQRFYLILYVLTKILISNKNGDFPLSLIWSKHVMCKEYLNKK